MQPSIDKSISAGYRGAVTVNINGDPQNAFIISLLSANEGYKLWLLDSNEYIISHHEQLLRPLQETHLKREANNNKLLRLAAVGRVPYNREIINATVSIHLRFIFI